MLFETEEMYTSYLEKKNYRWESAENRKSWKKLLKNEK